MSADAKPGTPTAGPSIVGSGLVKTYGSGENAVHALGGVDVSLQRGEFLCVMGPSGSGKSTLLHVLAGLVRPTCGEVLVAGTSIHALGDAEATRFRVLQPRPRVPVLSPAAAPERAGERGAAGDDRRDRAADSAARANESRSRASAWPSGPARPSSSSAAERCSASRSAGRSCAGRACVLADEPTGNLDSRSGDEILASLRRACDARGVTTLLVTHDPRAVTYADRVLVLQDGRVAEARQTGGAPEPA